MSPEERERLTFRLERWRAFGMGVLETANITFLLLIAERWFHAGPAEKSVLQSNSSVGLLLSPLVVVWAARQTGGAGVAASRLFMVAAVAVAMTVAVPSLAVFLAGSVVAFLCVAAGAPLFATIYESNYRVEHRGELFSRNVVLRIAGGMAFAFGAGKLLENDMAHWRWIMAVYAAALAVAAICLRRTPAVPVPVTRGAHPLRAFRYVRSDRLFRWTLVSWMLMGFANLTMLPLRVEYLAGREYNLQLSPDRIALLTTILPNAARLLFTRVWGRLFDRMNFFTLRILLNTGFMLGILSFFTGGGQAGLIAGAILFGVSNAGADIAWSLWVTKLAPPGLVTDYMAVHTFLTGVRGVIAPFAAFYLAASWGIAPTAISMAALILLASLLLLRERGGGLTRGSSVPPAAPGLDG